MKNRARLLVLLAGALLTLAVLGTALADPPTPTTPPPTPPTGSGDTMREWMDNQWGKGFFDQMHSSSEGMVGSCNTMMSSGAMTGSGGMMGNGAMAGNSGMMGNGAGPTNGRGYGGMMGINQAPGSGGWGGIMGNFMGGVRAGLRLPWF